MLGQRRAALAQISGNTTARRQLSKADRNRIYGALDVGASVQEISTCLGFNYEAVKTTKRRREIRPQDGDVKPRSGRPKKLSDRDERILLRTVRLNPKITYHQLSAQLALDISRSTYRRVLLHHNIKKWLAKKRPALTEELASARLTWARIHVTWTARQ
jgi:transposase